MSKTQPQPQPQAEPPDLTPAYRTFQHYTALGFLFGAPVLIALPPRKLDFYTFALGSSWALSANHLYKERQREKRQRSPFGGLQQQHAPEISDENVEGGGKKTRYEMVQEQLRREKRDRRLLERRPDGKEEEERGDGRPLSGIQKGLEKVWMGNEKPGWKERRLAEEQEKISQGEGYGGMIMDQIWEVWNWGKEKGEDLEKKDEDVLRDRRRREEFPVIGKDAG
ncbi:hypothetical protein GJ744_001605 [Endocarpon pusillum]|uniref:Rhomboid family membrane protein n=1 Tax=Endocarpon pusillum TaxID=364733 RepID=A0A8H7ABD2_9EURO|nr:hypothetical protein GJ744_001605 [Endocarpon pusillum]